MPIEVRFPGPLRSYAGGASTLAVSAATVQDALHALESTVPELYRCVCDETGAVRRHLNLFVGPNHVRDLAGLETPLRDGDVLTILPAVSGG